MSLLSELKTIMAHNTINLSCETGVFKGIAPDNYVVFTPLTADFVCSDDKPENDVQNVRVVIYSKGNYTNYVKNIVKQCIAGEITITNRQYITYDGESGYHQYAIDVAKTYKWEEN